MLVRMLVDLSGPSFTLGPGDEREFSQAEAIRLVQAGFAVPVSGAKVERAVSYLVSEARTLSRKERRAAQAVA